MKPLKALNLQVGPDELYDACPYCLARIAPSDGNAVMTSEESRSCQYHLGYLFGRDKKADVPDACMLCKDIIACMLGPLKNNEK